MKIYCISLPEKKNLKLKLNNLEEYFKDDFSFFDGIKLSLEDFKELVISNSISPFYTGGRKNFNELLGECGAWMAHKKLWKYIVDNKIQYSFILEDGIIFDEYKFDNLKIEESSLIKDITFLNNEFYINNNILDGFGLNGYIINYKTAKKLLKLNNTIYLPLDLQIKKLCNEGKLTFELKEGCVKKDNSIVHSTSDKLIDQNNDYIYKQDFRNLLERFFLNNEIISEKKKKIAFCATWPLLCTGYAKVGYEFTKRLANYFDVIYLGFQSSNEVKDRPFDTRIKYYDLSKLAPESPGNFGLPAIPKILEEEKPDYLMIYNDCLITSAILEDNKNFSGKKISYLDMVVSHHDYSKINFIKENVHQIFTFTNYFREHLINEYNFESSKVGVINHGLREMIIVPESRKKINLQSDIFLVLNINRNSHRKRLETTIRAFIEFWKKTNYDPNVRLQLNCNLNQKDGLDIINFVHIMCKEYNKSFELLSNAILNTNNPLKLSDEEIDIYYQSASVGITTSQGEGWGLTMFEMAYFGKPLISSDLPTHQEILKDYPNIEYCPVVGEYMENTGLLGIYPYFNYLDFANKLYNNYLLFKEGNLQDCDGTYIKEKYNWDKIVKKFSQDLI